MGDLIKSISILMTNIFPKWPSGEQLHNLSYVYGIPFGFEPLPILSKCLD